MPRLPHLAALAAPALPYGRFWQAGPFTCLSARSGLTCANATGNGLRMAHRGGETWQPGPTAAGRRSRQELRGRCRTGMDRQPDRPDRQHPQGSAAPRNSTSNLCMTRRLRP